MPDPRHLVPLGDLDPIEAAPLADAGLTPFRAIRRASPWLRPGARVLVVGLGALGQFGLQYLRSSSAGPKLQIAVRETEPTRLELAAALGADVALLADEPLPWPADAIFDFVGSDESLRGAIGDLSPNGLLLVVGEGGGRFEMGIDRIPVEAWVSSIAWGALDELYEVVRRARARKMRWSVERMPLTEVRGGASPPARRGGGGPNRAGSRLTERWPLSVTQEARQEPLRRSRDDVEGRRQGIELVAQPGRSQVGDGQHRARAEVLGREGMQIVADGVEIGELGIGPELDPRDPRLGTAKQPGAVDLRQPAEGAAQLRAEQLGNVGRRLQRGHLTEGPSRALGIGMRRIDPGGEKRQHADRDRNLRRCARVDHDALTGLVRTCEEEACGQGRVVAPRWPELRERLRARERGHEASPVLVGPMADLLQAEAARVGALPGRRPNRHDQVAPHQLGKPRLGHRRLASPASIRARHRSRPSSSIEREERRRDGAAGERNPQRLEQVTGLHLQLGRSGSAAILQHVGGKVGRVELGNELAGT